MKMRSSTEMKKNMRKIMGIILILLGIVLGLYVGIWVMFVGGIVQVIEQIRAPELVALSLAIGVARIVFSGVVVVGWICGMIFILPGFTSLK